MARKMAFLPPFWVAEWSLRFVLTVIADHFFLLAPPALAKPHGPRPFFQTPGASIHSPSPPCAIYRFARLSEGLPCGDIYRQVLLYGMTCLPAEAFLRALRPGEFPS
jgi:hypothetical protein